MAGTTQKKILLVLASGVAMGLSNSPLQQFRILGATIKEWKRINKENIHRTIRSLYKSNLIKCIENKDGTISVTLSKEGKEEVLRYNLEKISLKPSTSWDKKWRIVLFDIPEKNKKARDVLRFHLKKMGFFEYQKSVFITPHNCEKEIEFISEFYRIKPFIRIIIATKLDNEFHLKSHFKLR